MPDRARDIVSLAPLVRELGLPATVFSPLLAHARAVQADGDRLGLVSVADLGSVLARHTADSLLFALVRAPGASETWADIGSGAGFPGLVLACCYPEAFFTLIEPQRRRAGFLDLQCARLGLENVSVVMARAETLKPTFDVAVARALADPVVALELLRSLSPTGTQVLAVGDSAEPIVGVDDVLVERGMVDSPGRFFVTSEAWSDA